MPTSTDPKIIIAIDGYSSSGKSTMAKQLAARLHYVYVDSGAMYRAVTLYALENGLIAPDGTIDVAALNAALPELKVEFEVTPDGRQETLLNGRNVERQIRTLEVSDHVSPISAIPEVRAYLTRRQQELGLDKGIVMDGRDIGSTVFPSAEMKVFVDASPEVRAQRRYKELIDKGMPANYADVYANIVSRDHIDRTRAASPLRKADDALLLNNDNLSLSEQEEWLVSVYNHIISKLRAK